jgi:glycosyltransferase involved in cell wall biosynthesis
MNDVGSYHAASCAEQPDRTKTVLALSYVFPPAAYVGVYRILKYCKYLGAHGWRLIVIAPKPPDRYRDDQLCAEIPANVQVCRTGDPDPAKLLAKLGKRRVAPTRIKAPAQTTNTRAMPAIQQSRFKRLILGLLLECPDSHLFWVPLATLRGFWVLMTRRVDVIYSSSPPHSSHLAAFILGKCFRKPYVLDFRDPWEIRGPAKALMSWLKKLVVSHASSVVTVSDGERQELLQELRSVHRERVVVITNGYDPDDFASLVPPPRNRSRFRISHVGTIHPGTGAEFFEALRLLQREDPGLGSWLDVTLVGEIAAEYAAEVECLERAGVVTRTGFLPHSTALELALASDVLLILLGGSRFPPSELPAKLSEYLYLDKPILAVVRPGDLSDVLARSGAGISVAPHDPAAVAAAIVRLRDELQSNPQTYRTDREYITRFDRRMLAARFAAVLDEAAGVGG